MATPPRCLLLFRATVKARRWFSFFKMTNMPPFFPQWLVLGSKFDGDIVGMGAVHLDDEGVGRRKG